MLIFGSSSTNLSYTIGWHVIVYGCSECRVHFYRFQAIQNAIFSYKTFYLPNLLRVQRIFYVFLCNALMYMWVFRWVILHAIFLTVQASHMYEMWTHISNWCDARARTHEPPKQTRNCFIVYFLIRGFIHILDDIEVCNCFNSKLSSFSLTLTTTQIRVPFVVMLFLYMLRTNKVVNRHK